MRLVKTLIMIAVISLIGTKQLWAQNQTSMTAENEKTSDEFSRTSLYLNSRQPRTDLYWPYEEEDEELKSYFLEAQLHEGSGTGFHFSGQRLLFSFGKKFSTKTYVDVGVGVHFLQLDDQSKDRSEWVLQSSVEKVISPELYFKMGVKRDLIYPELSYAGILEGVTAKQIDTTIVYRPVEQWRIINRDQIRWYSDHNRKEEFDLAALYGLSTQTPWIWIGPGFHFLEFTEQKQLGGQTGYWSPNRFVSWHLRFDVNIPLIEELSLLSAGSIGKQKENDLEWGSGSLLTLGFAYGNRDSSRAEIVYTQIDSRQQDSNWIRRLGERIIPLSFDR